MNMSEEFRITFVCTGNTCRSPMAEVIARKLLSSSTLRDVVIGSAGVFASQGSPASDGARWATSEAGMDLDEHKSTPLTEDIVKRSDLILTMGGSHLASVQELGGEGRAQRLKDYAGDFGDVLDPFGGPDHIYQATYQELHSLIERVIRRLEVERT